MRRIKQWQLEAGGCSCIVVNRSLRFLHTELVDDT